MKADDNASIGKGIGKQWTIKFLTTYKWNSADT